MKISNSFYKIIVILIGLIPVMSACVRDGILECDIKKAQVKVAFDYSYSGISRSGTTIIFYPVENSSGREIVSYSTHNNSAIVDLLPGTYSVLVINETFGDFSNIKFRNTENYSNAEAHVSSVSKPAEVAQYTVYNSPDILVLDTLSSFTVTTGMIEDSNLRMQSDDMPANITFTLRRCVASVNILLHIKNMQYIRNASSSVTGFSEGHYLASRQNNTNVIAHALEDIKLVYNDEQKSNGVLTGNFNTFGLNPGKDAVYRLSFNALLIDGKTTYNKEFDVSSIIKVSKDDYGYTIDIELGTKENPLIEIPYVEAEEGTSPFDPDVDEWDEQEDIDIPLY